MPKLGPFPSREADLNVYFQESTAYLVSNAARLSIKDQQIDEIQKSRDLWNSLFPKSQSKSSKTATIVDQKNECKKVFINQLRAVYADIPASVINAEDRNVLGLKEKNTTKTPAPVPTTKPKGTVDTSKRLEHTIAFVDESGGTAKPEGVRGCQIWYKIGEPAVDPSELSYMATDTATPYLYHFAGEHAGKVVYYWLRWENTRGETGPWSDVVMATITG